MLIKLLQFNDHHPEDPPFEVRDEDGMKWIRMGIAESAEGLAAQSAKEEEK